MGLREDLKRFEEVGEKRRQDLASFMNHGEMQGGSGIKIPIKVISLPEFKYDQWDAGGIGQGDAEEGQPVEMPGEEGDGEGDGDDAGEGEGEHGYYEMDPEEFAEELDEQLGLDLDPKGKKVKEKTEGHLIELARSGPESTLDFDRLFKKGLKRTLAMYFDEEYMREVLKVRNFGPQKAYEWARQNGIPVSLGWLEKEYEDIPPTNRAEYVTVNSIPKEMNRAPPAREIDNIQLRKEDKRHKHPEITKEYEKNAVIVFIRDVSGSMGEHKRELVERVFTPLDWYLTGKYDQAEFIYIAHDSDAWEVERDDFFGIQSGGGTRISSAYELTQQLLDGAYPFSEWNRYVFAAGDGENWTQDTEENVIPLMEEIDANLHGYLEVSSSASLLTTGNHAEKLDSHFGEEDDVAVVGIESQNEVTDAIAEILSTEDSE